MRRHGRLTPERETGPRRRYRDKPPCKKAELTESEKRVLEVASRSLEPISPRLLARSIWPDRNEPGLVVAGGAMLARLERRGLLFRADREGTTRRYLPALELIRERVKTRPTPAEARSGARETRERARRLGRALSSIRKKRGLSLKQISRAIGASAGYLAVCECGMRLRSEPLLRAWAKKLGANAERLLFLGGYLAEDVQRLFRESGLAAKIAYSLVGLTSDQLRSVLSFVEGLEGAKPPRTREGIRENGFGRQPPVKSRRGRRAEISAADLERASRARTLAEAARLLRVGRHAALDALTRAKLPVPRLVPVAQTFPARLVQRVVEDYRAHKIGSREAAKELGCSRPTVRQILHDAGVVMHASGGAGHLANRRSH